MAINVISIPYNGGFIPDIIMLTPVMLLPSGNITRLNAMKRFRLGSLWSNLNVLTIFPPVWRMLRKFRCVQIFL